MKRIQTLLLVGVAAALTIAGCKKKDSDYHLDPEAVSHFMNKSTASYFVQNDPNSTFNLTIGATTVSNVDRTVTYSFTSPTGASAAQYSIPGTSNGTGSVVIPAGKTSANVVIKGVFAGYAGTRVDTLKFTITGGDIKPSPYNSTISVVLQKYCNVVLTALTGNYANTNDIDPSGTWGPYTAVVASATSTGATTAQIVINNLSFGELDPYPIQPITVNLDWSDPANFKATIPAQVIVSGNFQGYGPLTLTGVGVSTFSSCDNTFTLNYKLTVSAGSFGNFQTIMKR